MVESAWSKDFLNKISGLEFFPKIFFLTLACSLSLIPPIVSCVTRLGSKNKSQQDTTDIFKFNSCLALVYLEFCNIPEFEAKNKSA